MWRRALIGLWVVGGGNERGGHLRYDIDGAHEEREQNDFSGEEVVHRAESSVLRAIRGNLIF